MSNSQSQHPSPLNQLTLKSGQSYFIRVKPPLCKIIELEDVAFNRSSALYVPQERIVITNSVDMSEIQSYSDDASKELIKHFHAKLAKQWYEKPFNPIVEIAKEGDVELSDLSPLVTLFKTLEQNPNDKLFIVGHSDTESTQSANVTISEHRALSVLYLLKGDKENWSQLAKDNSTPKDIQITLLHFDNYFDWCCDPGVIDGIIGKKTKRAISSFQKQYSKNCNASIAVDGIVGIKTWQAMFDMYMQELEQLCGSKNNLDQFRQKLKFLDDSQPSIGCGDKYPINDTDRQKYRSRENRRVECIVFKQGTEPTIGNAVEHLYALKAYRFEHIDSTSVIGQTTGQPWGDIEYEEIEDDPVLEDTFDENDYMTECDVYDSEGDDEDTFWDIPDVFEEDDYGMNKDRKSDTVFDTDQE